MKNISFYKGSTAFWYLIFFGFSLSYTPVQANKLLRQPQSAPQQNQVSGTITDGRDPLPGVTITIKGKATPGTISDFNGQYTLSSSPTDILVFTFMGFKTTTELVDGRQTINIQLQEDITSLQEVRVNAGYYSVKDKERTGSISKITAKVIGTQPVNTPLEALQGRMAGIDIIQTSGVPGGGFEVKIRGQNSIMAGNAPLYIIDGVPYDAKSLGSSNSSLTIIPAGNISPLNSINPATIESIEVLKDADATAIYGSRGANGVVLITTKKGKQGKTSFSIGGSTGIANITRKRDLMGTDQYLTMRREAFTNDGIVIYPANAYDLNGTWDINRYTDWQDVLIGSSAITNQLQASVSGGSENTQFLLSGMHHNETTVFPGNFNYERITINSNLQHQSADKRFKVNFGSGYALEKNLLPGVDLTHNAYRLAPNAPPLHNSTGSLNWENSTWTNPLAQLEGKYTNNTNNLIANAVLSYLLFEGFEVKINTGYNFTLFEDNNTVPNTVYNPAFGLQSSASQSYSHSGNKKSLLIEPQLSWTKKGKKHTWHLLFGSTFQNQKNETLSLFGIGFADNRFIGNLNAATTLRILDENVQEYKYQSVFTRINYSLNDKLFLNATGRRDGSSRFAPGNRFGNFGALGAAWLFSDYLHLPWINYGKLRGSYGITGNDQIGDYQYLQTYSIRDFPYDGNIGLQPTRIYNANFKWEENIKKEAAVELGLFNNRISLTLAYYSNRSGNQLLNYALPGTTGFTSMQANLAAVVENSGWELEWDAKILRGDKLSWNLSLNMTLPKNRLLDFPGLKDSPYANQFAIGKPISIVKLYRLQGVNPDTGLFEFEDYNKDGVITSVEDRQYVADLTPKFYGGLSNSLNYKNWNFDIFFQFVKKQGNNEFYGGQRAGSLFNQPTSLIDRWQLAGDHSSTQQFTTGANPIASRAYSQFTQSSGTVSDASFVRLKSMAISYILPFGKQATNSCRISIQGQNLLTFTKFKGGDPEQGLGYIPPLRRITLGIQLHL